MTRTERLAYLTKCLNEGAPDNPLAGPLQDAVDALERDEELIQALQHETGPLQRCLLSVDPALYRRQKAWLYSQYRALDPSGAACSNLPLSILNFMDLLQDAAEEQLGMEFLDIDL